MAEDTNDPLEQYAFCVERKPVPGVPMRMMNYADSSSTNIRLSNFGKEGTWVPCRTLPGFVGAPGNASFTNLQSEADRRDGPKPQGFRRLNQRLCSRIVYLRIAELLENDPLLMGQMEHLSISINNQWCKSTKTSRAKLREFVAGYINKLKQMADDKLDEQLRREVQHKAKRGD